MPYLDRDDHIKPFLGINPGSKAKAYITYGAPANTDTVTVQGTVFTKVASGPTGNQFTTIAELTTLVNALADMSATNDGTTVTIVADAYGTAANAYTISRAGTGTMAVTGWAGGVNGDTSKDDELDQLNTLAASILNSILNVTTLEKHTVTDERFDGGVSEIRTKDFPVLSVTSIEQGSVGTLYTQTASYVIEKNSVLLDGVDSGGTGYEQSKITYVAGYVTQPQNESGTYQGQTITFPDDLVFACLLLIGGMWNRKRSIGVQSFTIQGKTVSFRDQMEGETFERTINAYKKTTILST